MELRIQLLQQCHVSLQTSSDGENHADCGHRYAVLYSYTPEIFPTKDRGTGNALTASANRVFGIMAVSACFASLLASRYADH